MSIEKMKKLKEEYKLGEYEIEVIERVLKYMKMVEAVDGDYSKETKRTIVNYFLLSDIVNAIHYSTDD